MGSETHLQLPAIDFSNDNLKPGTEEWESIKTQVRKALEEYGCFEAFFNKVRLDLKKDIVGAMEEIFELPLQTKLKNVPKKPYHGYVGQYPQLPLYESVGIEDPNNLEKVESFTSIFWPQGNLYLSKTLQSFSEQVSELDKIVRRMIVESLGLEKYMDEHMNSTHYLFRLMKYKSPQTSKTTRGIHTHTDKNIVTILYQNQPGLEVKTKNGEWINMKFTPHSFVVMIGDSLLGVNEFNCLDNFKCDQAWTNGRLHSPYHRVMMTGNEARYSCGLFSVPTAGYIVKAPEELIDEEHPLMFKPFDHVEFLGFYLSEAGQRAQSALKAYCGV